MDIVISTECQRIYNQVFLLLLQIKWAKYCLDTVRFSGKWLAAWSAHSGSVKHPRQIQGFRLKCCHFICSTTLSLLFDHGCIVPPKYFIYT